MELLGPAALRVEMAEEEHHEGGESVVLLRGDLLARADLGKDPASLLLRAEIGVAMVKPVVGETTSLLVEELVPRVERTEEPIELAGLLAGGLG